LQVAWADSKTGGEDLKSGKGDGKLARRLRVKYRSRKRAKGTTGNFIAEKKGPRGSTPRAK